MSYMQEYEESYLERLYEQHQQAEQRELLARVTTPEEDATATFECEEMFNTVSVGDSYPHKCLAGEPVFYYSYPKALIPGHIYSHIGRDEFYISRTCEYHFDQWMRDPDEREVPDGDLP